MLMRLNCFIILAVYYLKASAYNMYKKIGPAIRQTLQKYYRNINTEGQLRVISTTVDIGGSWVCMKQESESVMWYESEESSTGFSYPDERSESCHRQWWTLGNIEPLNAKCLTNQN